MRSVPNSLILEEKACLNGKKLGLITLNAPTSLNSLTLDIILSLQHQLTAWAQDPQIVAYFLQGGEKAFCAGGDIRQLYLAMKEDRLQDAEEFFLQEYRLDYWIHTSAKPFIVWGHGITMGGGIGLMAGANFRIVTEASRLAMPEITIGLFPDVGGSYFLNRMPHKIGLFLALTATRMNPQDALQVDLADFYLPHAKKNEVLNRLTSFKWSADQNQNHSFITKLFQALSSQKSELTEESQIVKHANAIEQAMTGNSIVEVYSSFEKVAKISAETANQDLWLQKSFDTFCKGSPTSAAVIFEQLKRAQHLSLKEVFQNEFELAAQFIRHHDLAEGIRALIIDKDQKPRWKPNSIKEVSVDTHFQSPWSEKRLVLTD